MAVFIPYNSTHQVCDFIPYIIHNVGPWLRPGGIGELSLTLERNSDFPPMSHSTFNISGSGRYFSKQLSY